MTITDTNLQKLRDRARERRSHHPGHEPSPMGVRAADAVANLIGSWKFVIVQSALLIAWLVFNSVSNERVDPFPFVLLNLLLSFQAAYTAPMIMMSQNRQSEIDRGRAIEDFEINKKAEIEIETLHQKIDLLREKEIAELTATVARLTRLLEERR